MAELVVLGGVTYTIPDPGESPNWATGLTPYLVAIAANVASNPAFMQYVAVAATPTSAISGKTYLVTTASLAVTMNLPTPAQNAWFIFKDISNNAASNNITLHRNGSEQIDGSSADKVLRRSAGTWIVMCDGTNWWTINQFPDTGLVAADYAAGSIANVAIGASAAIAYSKLNLSGSILNADINTSAAIAVSKLAALTVSRAVATDGSGFLTVATTTAAELAFVSGVTSAIQTQINTKAPTASPTLTGTVTVPNGSAATNAAAFGQVTVIQYSGPIFITTETDSLSNSYVDVTNASVTITPKLSTSHILIRASVSIRMVVGANILCATDLIITDSSNATIREWVGVFASDQAAATNVNGMANIIAWDAPGSTAAKTYKLRVRRNVNSNGGTVQVSNSSYGSVTSIEATEFNQ